MSDRRKRSRPKDISSAAHMVRRKRSTPIRSPSFRGLAPASKSSSAVKKRNAARGTKPETILRKAFLRRRYKFRMHATELPGCPDLVLDAKRIAIFCDGDFWHGRNWSKRRTQLAAGHNAAYWIAKIEANIRRDSRTRERLQRSGWKVVRIWESDLKADTDGCLDRVRSAVKHHTNARREKRPSKL